MGLGLKPSEASEGGGLLSDEDVTIVKVAAEDYDFGGKYQGTAVAFTFKKKSDGEEVTEHLSAGKGLLPSEDGSMLVPGTSSQLNQQCNFMMFVNSLVEAGFPEDKIEEDLRVFQGTECHVVRVKDKRKINRQPKEGGYEPEVFVVDSIAKLPWDAKGGSKGGGAAAAGSGANDDLIEEAKQLVFTAVLDAGGEIDKKRLSPAVFKAMKEAGTEMKRRNAITVLLTKDEFLKGSDMWEYDGKKLSMPT